MPARIVQHLKELPLNTVEDASTFFLAVDDAKRQGVLIPPINHLFFARVDMGLEFDPYNIRTVCRDSRPLNYFVVTKDHVVHVNHKQSLYQTVSSVVDWIREAALFAQIRQIHFFRYYLRIKVLHRLINASKQIKFQRSRTFLSKQLLVGSPRYKLDVLTFQRNIFDLHWHRDGASWKRKLSLVVQTEDRSAAGYSLDSFLALQDAHLKNVMQHAGDVFVMILSNIVEKAATCRSEIDIYRSSKGIGSVIGTTNKEVAAKGLNDRERQWKRKLVDFENVPVLIRIAHHLQLETMLEVACNSFFELSRSVQKHDLSSVWFFRVDCVISSKNEIVLSPTLQHVIEVVSSVIGKCVSSLASIPTCVESEKLQEFCGGIEVLPVRTALNHDAMMAKYKSNIIAQVTSDYEEAQSRLNMYEMLTIVSAFLAEWHEVSSEWDAILSSNESLLGAINESDIRNYVSKMLKFQTEIQKLSNRSFGTIVVACDATIQKSILQLKVELSEIEEILQRLIASQYATLKEECTDWVRRLNLPELNVDPYIKWFLDVEDANACFDKFSNYVTDLQNLLRLDAEVRERTKSSAVAQSEESVRVLRDAFQTSLAEGKVYHSTSCSAVKTKVLLQYKEHVKTLQDLQEKLTKNFGASKANEVEVSALSKLEKIQEVLSQERQDARQLDNYTTILQMEPLVWLEIGSTEDVLKKYVELWKVHKEVQQLRRKMDSTTVEELDGQELKDTIVFLFQRAFKAQKSAPGDTADLLVESLGVEKKNLPMYVELCNPALREDSWTKIFESTGAAAVMPSKRTLRQLEAVGLLEDENAEKVRGVVSAAVGVYELEQNIAKLERFWDERTLTVVAYAGRANAFVIDGVDEIKEELEEQQMIIQTCLASKYVASLHSTVEGWEKKLNLIHAVLDEWVNVQKSWMYLEFIFTSDDIKRQLPDESLLFSSADRFFSGLMKRCAENPLAAPICTEGNGDTLKKLQKCTYQLDCIQKKIDEYLETKRVAFPRFYFLSNDELLSILSDSRNPLAVQPHLQKCFDNIKELVFHDERTIVAMRSSEGEEVRFSREVKAMGNVESWLNDVERAMRDSLYDRMSTCLSAYSPANRVQWFFEHPAQCVTTVDQIIWTSDVEEVITDTGSGSSEAWPSYQDRFGKQLLDTVDLVQQDLSFLQRTVVSNLIVVDVHCRDSCVELAATPCSSLLDFDWQKQLRFYYTLIGESKKDCVVRHGAAQLPYGYEYLGNQPRLVITPLTERAFLTCTAALHTQKGAAPQGPAGTGKTESVKDLGKALARTVVVFNCSDGLDYRMMSQMFAGLAQAGAWACFDEFNRIELEVLSVVAQQMLDITTAIAQKRVSMSFEGHQIKLHANFGVFITMNPGYAGRTELPDNLKALFRPVCMMIPNYALIAEIMFYSEGYTKAQMLANKMIRLYSLASQQLSKQDHYDFGMRAVKAILVLAGRLKRADPQAEEELLLVRAIQEANLPKFLADDCHLFLALVQDFFPSLATVSPAVVSEIIRTESAEALKRRSFQAADGMLWKTQQLFDTLTTRHGLMLVGHTMTGKTTVRETLSAVLTNLGSVLHRQESGVSQVESHRSHELESVAAALSRLDARYKSYFTSTHASLCNPKSISMTELYGDVNPLTREWQDGVFSSIVRELVRIAAAGDAKAKERHWVVFDGPVDAIWIENLNTVLDDSKMLCLVNGERIRIPDTISLLFEVQDLRVASPATVSRCGMVYVDEECLEDGWTPILTTLSFAAAREFGLRWRHERFMYLCNLFFPPLLSLVRKECREYVRTVNSQLALSVFNLLKAAVMELRGLIEEDKERQETERSNSKDEDFSAIDAVRRYSRRRSSISARTSVVMLGDSLFDAIFIQSCTWGIGGNLTEASRDHFAAVMLELIRKNELFFPAEAEAAVASVFDYCIDFAVGDWGRWHNLVPHFQYSANLSYFDMIVPTEQTVVLQYLLKSAVATKHHVLLNGLTGTGKSSTVNNFLLNTLRTEDASSTYAAFSYTLSAQTSSLSLQTTIENKLMRRKADREFGAPIGKTLVVAVIDDCNVPQLEEYGAAPPIELLRQMITQGGFYDRKKLFFKEVVQTMLVACCGEPGGGKNELTPRFTSKLLCFCAPQLTETSMKIIFSSILNGFFRTHGFAEEVTAAASAVVESTIAAYRRIAVECLPTPDKTHCTFNLRDVSKVIQGVLQVKPAHCTTQVDLIALWSHEASRVFHDRLVDEADRAWWWRCCAEVVTQYIDNGADAVSELVPMSSIMYGTWANSSNADYQRIPDGPQLSEVAQGHLAGYNMQSTISMSLVFFSQAIHHLSRICRIISQPRGHALLVGVGGSGRSSLCRLAATMMNMDLQTVNIVRNYGIADFRDELRKALLDSGARGKEVMFLLSDPQLVCSEMLEDVNGVLNTGEVPGLMGLDDMEVIVRCCREACLGAGRPDTRSSIYQYFVHQCRERLHLCLCMSPMSGEFRDRLRMFPALVNCTTIDWFSEWPKDALLAVARATLAEQRLKPNTTSTGAASVNYADLGDLMVYIHSTVKEAAAQLYTEHHRRTHITPTSYLSTLALYQTTCQQLRQQIDFNAQRYRVGLQRLDSANATIEVLQQQIRDMQPGLTAAAEQVEEQKKTLTVEQREADVIKEAQSQEEVVAQELMKEAEGIRKECEEGLQQALPALEAAEQALETLSAKDIQEIKTFTTPPGNVEKTMNAVLLLLGEKEGWASAKACLGKMDFITRLTEYPRDSISSQCIKKLAVYIQDPDFVPDVIEKTSLPCRSMCMWVRAMHKYYFVAKEVAPKRERLAAADAKVEKARRELRTKQAALQQVMHRIESLQKAAAAAQEKADNFQRQIETAKARLVRADQLISGLASERKRWEEALVALDHRRGQVHGTAALGAGCVGYLGPFPLDYRERLLSSWRTHCASLNIPFDTDVSLEGMETEAVVQQWSLQSLPRDTYSIQNATVLHKSTRCCYMIDPQGQANTFIRKLERSRASGAAGLLQLKLSSPSFMRQIENAVQVGQAVLLEDVGETLDAALDPILLKQVHRVGGRDVVTLGDKEIPYDEHFRLYITTKLANPVLTPELQVKLTVIDFTVSREGLEDQLLADIVGSERAALQLSSDRCIISIAANREKIRALEEQVLRLLSEATGELLDNVELIHALQTSKSTSEKIAKELEAVEQTNKEINTTREMYRPLAARGSLIYGVIANMAKVDPMYEYSLQFFKSLVVSVLESTRKDPNKEEGTKAGSLDDRRSISHSIVAASFKSLPKLTTSPGERSALEGSRYSSFADIGVRDGADLSEEDVTERVTMLVEEVTWASYRVMCRGLFAPHKLVFSFLLATTIMRSREAIHPDEWSLFLRGGAGRTLAPQFRDDSSRPAYMPSGMWVDFGALCNMAVFSGVATHFFADGASEWSEWFLRTSGDAVLTALPQSLVKLSLWHCVMAIKVLRPNKVHRMAQHLVTDALGERYIRAPSFELADAFADSSKVTPIIFILSPGTDPTSLFLSFAEESGFADRKYMLSLGQDQGTRAEEMIRSGQREGSWVYLQNCHVYASWMPRLQLLVENIVASDVHEDYRLWLTSSPCTSFPAVVLQAGLKLTREPPMGLKGKVLDTLRSTLVADVWGADVPDAAGANEVSSSALRSSASATEVDAATLTSRSPRFRQLVWILAFFHGIVMERRRYRPLGWNIAYDWGVADFAAGLATMRAALSRYELTAPIPWEELTYMLGIIDYGGRVTDEWDTRCLQVITRSFFLPSSRVAPSEDFSVPALPEEGCSYAALLDLAEATIPEEASPTWFGLHGNATLSVEQQLSMDLVNALVSISSGGGGASQSGAGGEEGEEEEGENPVMQIALHLLSQLPDPLPRRAAVLDSVVEEGETATSTEVMADPAPLQTLLSHETDLYNGLLACMQSSLKNLIRALKGEVIVTASVEQMIDRIAYNQVPDIWAKNGFLSLKPLGAYFEELLERVAFMRKWGDGSPIPCFWLSGLFFPQGFITALLQARSRALRASIDSLRFQYRVLSPEESTAVMQRATVENVAGAYVYGLYLEGCGWDAVRGGLVESPPGALTVELPVIHFEPVVVASETKDEEEVSAQPSDHAGSALVYECPLYKVRTRAGTLSTTGVSTNYVTSLDLPLLDGVLGDHWTLRGVAALCALDT